MYNNLFKICLSIIKPMGGGFKRQVQQMGGFKGQEQQRGRAKGETYLRTIINYMLCTRAACTDVMVEKSVPCVQPHSNVHILVLLFLLCFHRKELL